MLHERVEDRVWVGLELAHDECVAADMLTEPLLLQVHHLLHLRLVLDQLAFSFEKGRDIVPEEVIRDDEGFLAPEALLASIADAV